MHNNSKKKLKRARRKALQRLDEQLGKLLAVKQPTTKTVKKHTARMDQRARQPAKQKFARGKIVHNKRHR